MTSGPAPTLDLERAALRTRALRRIVGMDEVGRGALAGPVTVGAVVVSAETLSPPSRVRDSKLLRPRVREALVPEIHAWAEGWAIGSATPAEIDALGIVGGLRLAGRRALGRLDRSARPDLVLLDGSHDWLTEPPSELLHACGATERVAAPDDPPSWGGPVRTVVKGDLTCASIAAASVLAKVARDAVMAELAAGHPEYGWAANKGYGSPAHRAALRRLGACDQHRRSWNLMRGG